MNIKSIPPIDFVLLRATIEVSSSPVEIMCFAASEAILQLKSPVKIIGTSTLYSAIKLVIPHMTFGLISTSSLRDLTDPAMIKFRLKNEKIAFNILTSSVNNNIRASGKHPASSIKIDC